MAGTSKGARPSESTHTRSQPKQAQGATGQPNATTKTKDREVPTTSVTGTIRSSDSVSPHKT